MIPGMHPLVNNSQNLVDKIMELERIKNKYLEDIRRESDQRNELETELKTLKSRLEEIDSNIIKSEEERALVKSKVEQGKLAQQKIENGMKTLLATLEREERVVKRASDYVTDH